MEVLLSTQSAVADTHSCSSYQIPQENKWQHQSTKQLNSETHFNPNQIASPVRRVDCTCGTDGTDVEKPALP